MPLQTSKPIRFYHELGLRLLVTLCVALYSVFGSQMTPVVLHHEVECHTEHHAEMDVTAEWQHDGHGDHDDGHHESEEGEHHHHHLSGFGTVQMAEVTPSSHSFVLRVTKLRPMSRGEVCPGGPVFELVKPPQVS